MKKIILGMVVVLLAALSAGAWWFYHSMDALVASAIRTYGPEITGVPVKLDGVKIVAAQGTAALHGLVLGTPKGFKAPHVLALDDVSMTLDVASLTSEVIVIKELTITRPDVIYERGAGGTNLDAILRNVDAYMAANLGASKDGGAKKSPARKLVIDHVVIKDCKAALSHPLLGDKTVGVSLPDLQLNGVGRKSNGATADEVTRQLLGALSQSLGRAVGTLNLDGAADSLKKGAQATTDRLRGLFGK
jgi:uncharacterized protein involved in outer membrane biogenesis